MRKGEVIILTRGNAEQSRAKLNYESVVDSFIPSKVPRVPTDQPLCPQEFMDAYKLKLEYQKAYMEASKDKQTTPQ